MLLFASLVATGAFLGLIHAIASSSNTRGSLALACGVSALATMFALYLQSPAILLNGALLTVVGLICLWFEPRPWRFRICSIITTCITYALLAWYAVNDVGEWVALRQTYPFESMTDRLAYEQGRARETQPISDGSPAMTRLVEFEGKLAGWEKGSRHQSLERLHASTVVQFVESEGFGLARTIGGVRKFNLGTHWWDDMPPSERLWPDSGATPSESVSLREVGGAVPPSEPANEPDLHEMRQADLLSFFKPNRFGLVRDREHVAGFVSHRFSKRIEGQQARRWTLDRLELVSLLKFKAPAVYLSETLPRMDKLSDVRTRPLDEFERQALTALRAGEDLQKQYEGERLRLLGSIRAAQQCLKCHDVERGELLGAFTYQLHPLDNPR
jgi:hypothetical protein